ncbi:hypothetical protein GCM10023189_44920 [Nibrella saemangeumensis]|uniref:RNA polymerase sigma-70 region 4 domain-containing protein n=1 Tax=Nibrella saemangeumensis TaxID=1084526 RepID=A0ABP8NGA8_9BACT
MDFTTLIGLLSKPDKTTAEIKTCTKELYVKYGNSLIGFGKYLLFTREGAMAEDIAIKLMYNTLDKATQRLKTGQITSETHLKNWLFAVFKNDVLGHIRALPDELYHEEYIDHPPENDDENESRVIRSEAMLDTIVDEISSFNDEDRERELLIGDNVWALLDTLSDHEKDIVLLRIKENLSYKQIAQRLNVTNVSTLRQLYGRAIEKLQKVYSQPTRPTPTK